jgi:Fur family peroxide stress response transcriptional regulator
MKSIDKVREIASENFDGKITGFNTYFYGLCSDCLEKSKV